jgi:uncharacterized protein (UPF0332 family)
MGQVKDDPGKEIPEFMEIIKRKMKAYNYNYQGGNYTECVAPLYFVFENMCKYTLAKKGFQAASHDGIQMLFAKHFVKPGAIDKKIHHHLTNLYLRRKDADYHGYATFDKDDVDEYAGWVVKSFKAMEKYFNKDDRDILKTILPSEPLNLADREEERVRELIDAIKDNDANRAGMLLGFIKEKSGPGYLTKVLEGVDIEGTTVRPLDMALAHGFARVADVLVKYGAKNTQTGDSEDALKDKDPGSTHVR